MSLVVPVPDLPSAIAERRATPYLISVGDTGPKVVALGVEWVGATLQVRPGRGTVRNVAGTPVVTLLWPTDADHPEHSLLVDGTATVEGDVVVVVPTSAILHVSRE